MWECFYVCGSVFMYVGVFYVCGSVFMYVGVFLCMWECFYVCDLSKEKCSSLKMFLGSKHVGAILNVLM